MAVEDDVKKLREEFDAYKAKQYPGCFWGCLTWAVMWVFLVSYMVLLSESPGINAMLVEIGRFCNCGLIAR